MKLPLVALAFLLFTLVFWLSHVAAYPVAFALTLDELSQKAGLIVKVKAVETKAIDDPWFEKHPGYTAAATTFEVLGVHKGKLTAKRIEFRHWLDAEDGLTQFYSPQFYRFEAGKSYLLWAQAPETEGETPICRTIWKNHTTIEDQGVLRAADDVFHPELAIKDAAWHELSKLAQSERNQDAKYALEHLDVMSLGDDPAKFDFPRAAVVELAGKTLDRSDFELIKHSLKVIGQNNPYSGNEYAPGWLATVGSGDLPGYGSWPKKQRNVGAHAHWQRLVKLIDGRDARDEPLPPEIVARAIRALGWSEVDDLFPHVERWTKDGDPLTRQAATLLLADFPRQTDRRLIQQLAKDADAKVRLGAALSIGYGQFVELLPELATLADDADAETRRHAIISLLSFAPEHAAKIWAKHVDDPNWGVLFSNALAKDDPQSQRKNLIRNVRANPVPDEWWGGSTPWGVAWERLYLLARSFSDESLQAGRHDDVLDGLESPSLASGQKGPNWFSSSQPRDLYAFYLQRGLTARAKKFREQTKKAVSFDIDYFFKMVDENPKNYGWR